MGQVAQVKIPMRMIKDGFKVSASTINAAGDHATILVRAVKVVVHADGQRVPGYVLADIRGKYGSDGYLTTKDYSECVDVAIAALV